MLFYKHLLSPVVADIEAMVVDTQFASIQYAFGSRQTL